jgi:dephospho-CoA kinase
VSKWRGKFVIGLTGNIATGKSVVRRMLQHLGAYTIDADALAHRAIAREAPGYAPVLQAFGNWLLGPDGEIDRSKLRSLAFSDSRALLRLEQIIHPLVIEAAEILIERASQQVIVVEAIKLLEGPLAEACDAIWVTDAPEDLQIDRLMQRRGLRREEAQRRAQMQSPQHEKVAAATVVISNTGAYEELWSRVLAEWKKVAAEPEAPDLEMKSEDGEFSVRRGRPGDSQLIADLLAKFSKGRRVVPADEVLAAFGDKAYLLLRKEDRHVGLAGWQVENLVARTTDVYVDESVDATRAVGALVREVERLSGDLQCEASLVFPAQDLSRQGAIWSGLGYERRNPADLAAGPWQDAAMDSMPAGAALLFKQLRQERVLRPI